MASSVCASSSHLGIPVITTPELIDLLAQHATPVRRLRPPLARAALWLLLAGLLFALLAIAHGLRPDWQQQAARPTFVIGIAASLATGVLAAVSAFLISLPDRSRRWALLPVPTLLVWLSHGRLWLPDELACRSARGGSRCDGSGARVQLRRCRSDRKHRRDARSKVRFTENERGVNHAADPWLGRDAGLEIWSVQAHDGRIKLRRVTRKRRGARATLRARHRLPAIRSERAYGDGFRVFRVPAPHHRKDFR